MSSYNRSIAVISKVSTEVLDTPVDELLHTNGQTISKKDLGDLIRDIQVNGITEPVKYYTLTNIVQKSQGYIQYHPGGGHHGPLVYWKVTSSYNPTARFWYLTGLPF